MPTPPPEIFKAYDIRGLYGEQIDGEIAESIGRAFARVLAQLEGKPVGELRVGLGRDMRLTAPELAARYREGLLAEGVHVLDAGQVGTEMLYYLVGSRGLDGGLDVHRLAQPEGVHRLQAGARGGAGAVGRQRHPGHPPADRGRPRRGRKPPRPRGTVEEVDVYAEFQQAALGFIDPETIRSAEQAAEGRGGRRQRDGRPDGRPAAGGVGARADRDLLDPRRQLPRPRAQPAAAREPAVRDRQGARDRRRPRDRLGRGRRPLLLHRRHRELRGRRLPHRAAGGVAACQEIGPRPPRGDPLRRARLARGARHGAARRRDAVRQPRGPRLLQDAHARGGLAVRG